MNREESDRWARHDYGAVPEPASFPSVQTKPPTKFDVTLEVTAAQLAELEKEYTIKKVVVSGNPEFTLPGHVPGVR